MIKFIESCRETVSRCYQSQSDFDRVIGKVIFHVLCFCYFFVKNYAPSKANEVAERLLELGRVKDLEQAKKDILNWYTCYRYEPWEYAAYSFEEKTKEERLKFYSDNDRIRFGSIVNNIIDCKILDNKAKTYELYKDAFKRDVILINGEQDFPKFEAFCQGRTIFFGKPITGSYGVKAIKLTPETDLKELFAELLKTKLRLFEEPIQQCQEMSSLNPESVNTVRLATLLTGDKIDILFSYVRCGRKGFSVDNSGVGGFLASVDPETGIVFTDGVSKDGNAFPTHPDSGVTFKGFKVPRYEEAKELVANLAKRLPTVRYVGWDLAVTDQGVVVVEANSFAMMSGCQFSTNTGKKEYFESFLQNKA